MPCAGEQFGARSKRIGAAIRRHLGRQLIIRIDIDHRRVIVRRPQDLRDLRLLQIEPKADRVFRCALPRSAQVVHRRATRRVQESGTVGSHGARRVRDGAICGDHGISLDIRIVALEREIDVGRNGRGGLRDLIRRILKEDEFARDGLALDARKEGFGGVDGLILDHDTRLEHIRRVSIRNENAIVFHLERGGFQGRRGAVHKEIALNREVVGERDGAADRQGATDKRRTRDIQKTADARRSFHEEVRIHRGVSMERRELVDKQGLVQRGRTLHLEGALERSGLGHLERVIQRGGA